MRTISQAYETIVPDPKPTTKDFNKANFRGILRRWIGALAGRSTLLLDIDTILRGRNIRNHSYSGTTTVRINQIKGSEGRCQDFDQNFNPLKDHNQNRWVSIANAWDQGIYLPAVELIKIGDNSIDLRKNYCEHAYLKDKNLFISMGIGRLYNPKDGTKIPQNLVERAAQIDAIRWANYGETWIKENYQPAFGKLEKSFNRKYEPVNRAMVGDSLFLFIATHIALK